MRRIRVVVCLALLLGLPSAHGAEEAVDFAHDIQPILEAHCIRCHKPDNAKGDLSLATFDDLATSEYVVAGKPGESYLVELITGNGDDPPQMPKEGDALSKQQVALIRRWIKQGAAWPKQIVLRERSKADGSWWSLQPIASGGIPDVPRDASFGPRQDGNTVPLDNPIDRFILAKLLEKDLAPNPPAERRALIRRATYDLTGLPPSPEQVAAFIADDAPDAYEKLIDRLLDSPHYGERWGRHWLDVVRFGESNGFERNVIIDNLWPFRDYVIRSLNEDRPFDRLVLEHLAGDVIGAGDPQVEIGTAFLVCGPYDNVGNQDPVQKAQIRANTIDEIIRATGEAFLGVTIGCARCHDHKFDPLMQRDYYSLYATFAGTFHGPRTVATAATKTTYEANRKPLVAAQQQLTTNRSELLAAIQKRAEAKSDEYQKRWTRPVVDRYGTEERFAPVQARYVRLTALSLDAAANRRTGFGIDEFEVWTADERPVNVALAKNGGRAQGASRVAEDFAEAYGANLTIDGKFGARWIAAGSDLTITLAQPKSIDRVVFSSDRPRALGRHGKTIFVGDYKLEISLDGENWRTVADSSDRLPPTAAHRRQRLIKLEQTDDERRALADVDRRLAETNRKLAALGSLPSWWVGQFRTAAGPFHTFRGGDPQKQGDTVKVASLQVLGKSSGAYELAADASQGQRRLALAKWIVSKENPLTARVLANRLWHYHFGVGLVDTPSDFGYMGGRPTHPRLLDWLAEQLHASGWKLKPLHKQIMLSQTYRQSSQFRQQAADVDAAARLLWRFPPRRLSAEEIRDTVLSVSGKLDKKMGGPGFRLYRYLQDNVATYVPLDRHGPETFRRAVYHQNARAAPVDLMTDFDSPDCAFSVPRRAATITPLQALTMLNHQFTLDMSRFLAKRIEDEAGNAPQSQIQRAYALCYSRRPTAEETKTCLEFVKQHSLAALCRALLNTSELIYVE